jgi:hypothetical protein
MTLSPSTSRSRCLPNARVVTIAGSGHFPQGDTSEFPMLASAFLGK